jgi:hypothetical protein
MAEKRYWALADMRYPAGDAEYVKAIAGKEYEEIVVPAGSEVKGASEKTIKAFLSMGREVITTEKPVVKGKAVKE